MKTLRDKVFSNSTVLLLGRLIQMFLQVLMGIIIPKLVSPLKFGLWRSLMIIHQYATFANIGTYAAMGLEMPYHQGKGDFKKKNIVKTNTFYFNVLISSIIGIILIISSLFTNGEYREFYVYGFVLFAFLTFFSNISDFYLQLLRVEKEFSLISKLTVLQISSNLILSISLLIILENVLVLAFAIIFSNLLLIYYAVKKCGIPIFNNFNKSETVRLIYVGFPLLLNGILFELIRSLDQILIIAFLNPEALGYYGLAIAIQRIGFLIPGVLGSTTMPYLYEEYGRTHDIQRVSKIFEKSLTIVSLICAIVIVGMCVFIHLLINYYLTEYTVSLPILYTLLLGMFSIGILGLPEILAAITGKMYSLIKWQSFSLFLTFIFLSIVIKLDYGIFEIALASVTSYFIYSVGVLAITFNIYEKKLKNILKKIFLIFTPYVFIVSIYALVNYFIVNQELNFLDDLFVSCVKMILIILFFLPVLVYYDKKINAFKTIVSAINQFLLKKQ